MTYHFSFNRYLQGAFTAIYIATGTLLINGCEKKQQVLSNNQTFNEEELHLLKLRVDQLEQQINSETKNSSKRHLRNVKSPIKSMTFRIGTTDDRLRIYWSDGSNSDLPCTKEQSIWVCG